MSMTGANVNALSATEIARLISSGELSAREAVESALNSIETRNPSLNAIVAVDAEGALAEADKVDAAGSAARGPIAGVPVAVKDITETANLPTTFGSCSVGGAPPWRDAVVVERIRAAGGIIIAKTAVPEFALRPTTESVRYGATRNPWNPEFGGGGSSGGSAVSVAAAMVPLAQGTDGGGSIRIPAACNGVVGIKPSRARIPAAPAYYESWAGLSTDGAFGRTVADAALLLEVMSGPIIGDPYAVALGNTDFVASCKQSLTPCSIAYTLQPPHGAVAPAIATHVEAALAVFEQLGHRVAEAAPAWQGLYENFLTVLAGNAGALRFQVPDERLGQLEGSTLALVLRGGELSAASYCFAVDELRRRAAAILGFWGTYDFLVTPVVTHLPGRIDEVPLEYDLDGRWSEYMDWQPFTYPFNVTGQPAISLPCGLDPSTGLPVALQVVAAPGQEAKLLSLAAAYEQARPWPRQSPLADHQMPMGTGLAEGQASDRE